MRATVYADNAATTQLSKRTLDAMLPFLKNSYGNASGLYSYGREARIAVENARKTVASVLGAGTHEIYFTSCGTESDNWALRGIAERYTRGHMITTCIEHHAILHTMRHLERRGFDITYLPVDRYGQISLNAVEQEIRDDTILISVMAANNEIGTIMPIKDIGAIAHKHGVLFHTDAVQAAGHIPMDVNELNIDMLSLSAHKFHGPKGCGVLYIRDGVEIGSLIYGGGQERGMRAGTENVAGIVGLAASLEEASGRMVSDMSKVTAMRDRLISGIMQKMPGCYLTGHGDFRLPGIASFVFEGIEGNALIFMLDKAGICASTGSACTSGSLEPSRVLTSIGLPPQLALGSLRLSIGRYTSEEDISYILDVLPDIIKCLRKTSPHWKNLA